MTVWQEFFIALGLMLVLEGIGPFVYPTAMRRVYFTAAHLREPVLRTLGLLSMLFGLILMYGAR
ncbi:MAG TPA: DUF2065 domain-containing protein [Gammaproteobacteria bacterium]|nr:DUF2065 domain-containing protein [Gammaproteobacteria bacterium]